MKRFLTCAALLGLYALGLLHWAAFLHWGDLNMRAYDWGKEHTYYLIEQRALRDGCLPYHAPITFHGTDRFLGNPETNLSPHILLLPWLSTSQFALLDGLVFYTVGFAGCLWARRRHRLGLAAFSFLFLLLLFNGFIVAHLAVGHSMWLGYFWLPFFGVLVLEWVQQGPSLRVSLLLGLVLFAMMLRGSFHIVVWCWLFLLLLVLFQPRWWRHGLLALGSSVLLGFFRLLPAAWAFGEARREEFLGGYPTLLDLLASFVVVHDHTAPRLGSITPVLGWWEFDNYLGLVGFGLLVYFGIYLRCRDHPAVAATRYAELDGPMAVLALLALNNVYFPVWAIPLTLARAEQVSSRFVSIPVVLLLLIAVIRMQRLLETVRPSGTLRVLLVCGLVETAVTLAYHNALWRPGQYGPELAVFPAAESVEPVTRPDPFYVGCVHVSAVVSLLGLLLVLGAVAWSWRRPAAPKDLTEA